MNLLRRIFERSEPDHEEIEDCRHGTITPHWEDPSRLGDEAAITSYRCTTCGEELTPEKPEMPEGADPDGFLEAALVEHRGDEADERYDGDERGGRHVQHRHAGLPPATSCVSHVKSPHLWPSAAGCGPCPPFGVSRLPT